MGDVFRRCSRRITAAFVALVAGAVALPVHADEPLPGACKQHGTAAVNPGCLPALTDDVRHPAVTLPNLVPEVHDLFAYRPSAIDPATGTVVEQEPRLYFDTRAQNFGTVPLDVLVDDLEEPETSTVSQCTAWTGDLVCVARRVVGGFSWHAGNRNARFVAYSTSELRRLGADGRPDYSPAGLIDAIDRALPCFRDNAKVGDGGAPAPLYPAAYQMCPPARQGVTPGWTAAYDPIDPGEQFPIEGLPDGLYAIVARIDPAGHLLESNDGDNVTETIVELSGGLRTARVVARHYP